MKRKTIDTLREGRLWIMMGLMLAATFPEVREGAVKQARRIKEMDIPGKVKDKIHSMTRRKED